MCGAFRVILPQQLISRTSEELQIELLPPTGVSIYIKRIRMAMNDVAVADAMYQIRVYRETSAGTGSTTTATPVGLSPSSPSPVTTCIVNDGTTSAAGGFVLGSTSDKLMDVSTYSRGTFEWIARDRNNYIWSNPAERLAITMIEQQGGSNQNICIIECDFVE